MLKMANCYTGREYVQARLRAYKPGILAWVRPVAKHISSLYMSKAILHASSLFLS